jgi:hypothetical protein
VFYDGNDYWLADGFHLRQYDAPPVAALAAAIRANREAVAAIARDGLRLNGHANASVLNRTSKLISSLSTKLRLPLRP